MLSLLNNSAPPGTADVEGGISLGEGGDGTPARRPIQVSGALLKGIGFLDTATQTEATMMAVNSK